MSLAALCCETSLKLYVASRRFPLRSLAGEALGAVPVDAATLSCDQGCRFPGVCRLSSLLRLVRDFSAPEGGGCFEGRLSGLPLLLTSSTLCEGIRRGLVFALGFEGLNGGDFGLSGSKSAIAVRGRCFREDDDGSLAWAPSFDDEGNAEDGEVEVASLVSFFDDGGVSNGLPPSARGEQKGLPPVPFCSSAGRYCPNL